MCRYLLSLTVAIFASTPIFSNPTGGSVVFGSAEINESEFFLNITSTSPMTVIEWDEFSIGQEEKVHLSVPTPEDSILIRVVGDKRSKIQGELTSNGQIYFISPGGFVVSADGSAKAGSFLASTLDVGNDEFISQGDLTFAGESSASIINRGSIEATYGDLYLIGRDIQNKGIYKSEGGAACIAASSEAFICLEGKERVWIRGVEGKMENSGRIEALRAELKASGGDPYSFAINQMGIIQAKGTLLEEGTVILFADLGSVDIAGVITASDSDYKRGGEIQILGESIFLRKGSLLDASGDWNGGKVLVGLDYQRKDPSNHNASFLFTEDGAIAKADARENGNGGTVIFFSDRENLFLGMASAQGGRIGGDGGLVEVSSLGYIRYLGKVSTLAPFGKMGICNIQPNS